MTFTDGKPTPERFRLWSGIAAIAGALERRCYAVTAGKRVYPNLYTLLVGPPASGKSIAIDATSDLWTHTKVFHIAPRSITSAALVDALKDADKKINVSPTELIEYHSLLIPCSEFGVFIHSHDLEMMANLTDLYDCGPSYGQRRRHVNGGKTIEILNPQLNIIAGAQPGFLAEIMPEAAWRQGFTSRLLMIYAPVSPMVPLLTRKEDDKELRAKLIAGLLAMSKLRGHFRWEQSAGVELERWYAAKLEPVPQHSRLEYYAGRRILHWIKLSMIASISRQPDELIIRLEDLQRARDWLLDAEKVMPDIFRDMNLKSDHQVIHELHFYLWSLYAKNQKPIHEEHLWSFLSNKAPSEKIQSVIELAEKSGLIARMAGEKLWTPKAKISFGIE